MEDVELGLKRSATLPFTITEKVLMFMGEVDIGLRPAILPPIIQVSLVDHWIFLFVVMREVYIGLRPTNFLHINMVGFKFSPKVPSRRYLTGCERRKPT